MFNRRVALWVMFLFCASGFAYAQDSPWQKSDFDGYINGDGSNIESAVIIKVPDTQECDTDVCEHDVFDGINKQEREYLSKMFGEEEVQWSLEDKDNWEVDLKRNDKYYDVSHIKLIDTDERRVVYFDITDPILRMKGEIE